LKCIKKIYDERHVSLVRREGLGYIVITDEKGENVKNVTEIPYASINDKGHNVKSVTELPSASIKNEGHDVKIVTEFPSVFINDKGHYVKYARLRWLL